MITDLSKVPVAALAMALYIVYWAISSLRKKYPHEIYVIWLVFSFFFVIFFGIAIVAEYKGTNLTQVCGDSYASTCRHVYEMLTNVADELYLIAIFSAATIFPQILAYILSGLSGSATAPQYIWAIQQTAAWSFIKFAAGLSGILIAQPIAKLLFLKVPTISDFVPATTFLAAAFSYAWWHLQFWVWWDRYHSTNFQGDGLDQCHVRLLLKMHAFFTRAVSERPSRPLAHRVLMALAQSDAIYDFITNYRNEKEPSVKEAMLKTD